MTSRRDFLAHSASCAAHLALAAAAMPLPLRSVWAWSTRGAVVAREPFGTLEKVAEGVWALVSDPFGGDRTTLCNGGLIAGRDGVVAIEGFFQSAGARWLAERARELTGRWPTHVALTHHHADHVNGVAGYLGDAPRPVLRATAHTQETALARATPADADRVAALRDVVMITVAQASTIDLGGHTVRVVPRDGHTSSDTTLELDDPSVVFCGDLVWNGIFPNYVDATPSRLSRQVRMLRRPRTTIYVPGHGAIADDAAVDRYLAVLDEVERAARQAHASGMAPADAASRFALPSSLGEWRMFGKVFFERAFTAWERELRGR